MNREELFDRYLRGELNAEDATELRRMLAEDAAASRAFVEHVNETTLFVRIGSQIQSARLPENVVPLDRLPRETAMSDSLSEGELVALPNHRSKHWRFAALAACLVALAALAVSLHSRSAPRRSGEVYVSGAGMRVLRGGTSLDTETIELRAGDVITAPTNSGAVVAYEHESTRVEIQPGSVLVFGDSARGKRFELRHGVLEARVAPQPSERPMCIKTPQGRATVLGTELVMRADDRGTKLDVIEGKVELACRASGKKVVVKAGFAATLNPRTFLNVSPLCSSNCILRECRNTNSAAKSSNSKAE